MQVSDVLPWVSGLGSLAAVSVAVRALRHARNVRTIDDAEEQAAMAARTMTQLREYGDKFERAFATIERVQREATAATARVEMMIHEHEKECAKDKATLAANLAQASDNLKNVTEQLSYLTRIQAYANRDLAEMRTAAGLGQVLLPPSGAKG